MRKLFTFAAILAAVIFIVSASYAQPVNEGDISGTALIESVAGNVRIIKADSSDEVQAEPGMIVYSGDMVKTYGMNANAGIRFEDGTLINITQDSELSLEQIRSMQDRPGEKTTLNLEKGYMHAVFAKLGPSEESRFRVKTPTAVCGVLGTTIYIDAATGTVYVSEGMLKVVNIVTGQEYEVYAGEIITINIDGTTEGSQPATEGQIENMLSKFTASSIEVLGYSVVSGYEPEILFTPDPEEPASRI